MFNWKGSKKRKQEEAKRRERMYPASEYYSGVTETSYAPNPQTPSETHFHGAGGSFGGGGSSGSYDSGDSSCGVSDSDSGGSSSDSGSCSSGSGD